MKCNSNIGISHFEEKQTCIESQSGEKSNDQHEKKRRQSDGPATSTMAHKLRTEANTRRTVSAGALLNSCYEHRPVVPSVQEPLNSSDEIEAPFAFAGCRAESHDFDLPPNHTLIRYNSHFENQIRAAYRSELCWRGNPLNRSTGGCVTSNGIISFSLRKNLRLDFTIDKACRICDYEAGIIMSLSSCGTKAAFIHPSGLIYQYGGTDGNIELSLTDYHGFATYAKMSQKGISFTSDKCALIYLVDSAGIRSSNDVFSDLLAGDFTIPTFMNNSAHQAICISACLRILQNVKFWKNKDGTENWVLNGFRVTKEKSGCIRVARDLLQYKFRLDRNGTCSLSTPNIHCTAALGGHIYAKSGDKKIHYDGQNFIVKNGSHSGGFDRNTQLKLF